MTESGSAWQYDHDNSWEVHPAGAITLSSASAYSVRQSALTGRVTDTVPGSDLASDTPWTTCSSRMAGVGVDTR